MNLLDKIYRPIDKSYARLARDEERLLILAVRGTDAAAASAGFEALALQYAGALRSAAYDHNKRQRAAGRGEVAIEDLGVILLEGFWQLILEIDLDRYAYLAPLVANALRDALTAEVVASLPVVVPERDLRDYWAITKGEPSAAELDERRKQHKVSVEKMHSLSMAAAATSDVHETDFELAEDDDEYRGLEDQILAETALKTLTDEEHEVVRLAFGFGDNAMSIAEIAEHLGYLPGKVRRLRVEALGKMRGVLGATGMAVAA